VTVRPLVAITAASGAIDMVNMAVTRA